MRWASETFPGRAVLNTSFQYTGVAMIHIATSMGLNLRFATIDTLRLHSETYAFMEEVKARYGCHFEVIQPKRGDVERMVARHGEYLFFDSKEKQEHCCQVRKEWPNNALLQTADCWISGQRWDQSAHRQQTAKKATLIDDYSTRRKIVKLNPLVDWSEEELMEFTRTNDLPVHPALRPRLPELWLHHLLHPNPARRTQTQRSLALVQRTSRRRRRPQRVRAALQHLKEPEQWPTPWNGATTAPAERVASAHKSFLCKTTLPTASCRARPKNRSAGTAALALLEDATELFVAQGQRVLRFDLVAQRPADEELLSLLLGRSGKLRAPAFRYGTRLIVGYNQALLPTVLD